MKFFKELQRRNVFRVAVGYVVSSWLLIQVADLVLQNIGAPAWVMQTIMLVLALGFPVVVFFSWAYEVTPEGIKRESEVDRSQSITHITGRKLDRSIIAVLIVALAYFIWDSRFGGDEAAVESSPIPATVPAGPAENTTGQQAEQPTPARASIAVLPFTNRSNREEDQFFTDGIHDDLLTTLAKIGSLKVISRTSVMEYKDTTKKIPEIARELSVAHILEGGIQRSGQQVRINVQLIDAASDEHLWAEIYDRELTAENLFAIQSEISHAIAGALETELSPEEQERISAMPTRNLEAYDAYLHGRQLMATRRTGDLEQAVQAFQKAVALDPGFALAWVGVADSHMLRAQYRFEGEAETIPIREQAIQTALSIDPNNGEAFASLATIQDYRGRTEEAEAAFRKAIELSPNYATAYHWYANSIQDPLRSREVLSLLLKASELDPRSTIIGNALAGKYFSQGLYSRGEQQALRMIDLYPDVPQAYHRLVVHYVYAVGEYAKGLLQARKMLESDPGSADAMRHQAEVFLEIGDLQSVRTLQEQIAELDPNHYLLAQLDFQAAEKSGNDPATAEAANWLLSRETQEPEIVRDFAAHQLMIGDADRARELFVASDPEWLQPQSWEKLIRQLPADSCVFSWILLHTGDPELGAQLLEQATTFLERDLPAAIEHADSERPDLCFLAGGDSEKALASLEEQMAHNHIWQWDVRHRLPIYDAIRDDPRFTALTAEYALRIEQQRQAIAAIR